MYGDGVNLDQGLAHKPYMVVVVYLVWSGCLSGVLTCSHALRSLLYCKIHSLFRSHILIELILLLSLSQKLINYRVYIISAK